MVYDLDSGVDGTHEDLKANLWNGISLIPGKKSTNWNTDSTTRPHGTGMAGVIAAINLNYDNQNVKTWKTQTILLPP